MNIMAHSGNFCTIWKDFLNALIFNNNTEIKNILEIVFENLPKDAVYPAKRLESEFKGLMLGLLLNVRDTYRVTSHRESGYGYYDIMLFPPDKHKYPAIIIELKIRTSVEKAIQQMHEKCYATEAESFDCKLIHFYAFALQQNGIDVAHDKHVIT